jgi:hypothetical protein
MELFISFAPPKPTCSFLLLAQKKRTKEKGAGNDNFSQNGRLLHKPYWRYRFGCSSHHFRVALAPPFIKLINIMIVFGFLMASDNFGIKRLF